MNTSSTTLRSKAGCWTCRLRRKKCDEHRPICTTCSSLQITCHGYGAKPEFMDGGAKEKAMVEQIKQIVKHTSRRKGRLNGAFSRFQRREVGEVQVVALAPKPGVKETAPVKEVSESDSSTVIGTDSSPGALGDTNGSSPNSSHEEGELSSSWLPFAFTGEEAVLLMHFLDNVFPLQYPLYKPCVAEGGRGWVISLLLKTKPLYHACLALATYHRGSILLERYRGPCGVAVIVEKEKHLALCLRDFRDSIESVHRLVDGVTCPNNSLGLMACIVQLIYFELFAGNDTWKIHLQAATTTFSAGYCQHIREFGGLSGKEAISDPEHDHAHLKLACEPEVSEQIAIFKFMGGITLWLDILASITMARSPNMINLHSQALGPNSQIKLDSLVGCQNWTAVQFGRIASLHSLKITAMRNGCPNTVNLESQAEEIRNEVQSGLNGMCLAALNINPRRAQMLGLRPPEHIGRMFGFAAAIYLELVMNGFEHASEAILLMKTEAMSVLQTQIPADMMHTIICPLYLLGSIASPDEQVFFRYVFSSLPVLDPSLEHRSKILPLLEKVWHARSASQCVLTWQESLDLADGNLLLI